MLNRPVVLLNSACEPVAVLNRPVVLRASAAIPSAVLSWPESRPIVVLL